MMHDNWAKLLLLLALPSAIAAEIGDYIQQGLSPLQSTGSGDAYASSCQSALWAWETSSSAYGLSHTTFSLTTAQQYPTKPPSVSASSVTVLCDGYSRAVGSASFVSQPSNLSTTYTALGLLAPYPTPAPCSINQDDCAKLYNSYSTAASSLIGSNTTLLAPPCNRSGGSSIPFSSIYCMGEGVNGFVGVRGSSVRLLYWPIRTVDNPAYFCTQTVYSDLVTPITLPGTPTGSGPNTFVTGTLTITSPTVALSYSGLSRVDGCGATVEHTIITLKPEELHSIRGGRALFDTRPFNYGDLNWMCPSPNNGSHFTVQDVEGPNCYQNFPAQAYWNAAQYFDLAMYANVSQIKEWTMINNYQPYVLPASHVWSETMQSLWGTDASWYIDGSWDPPIALSEQASAAKPTLPASYSAVPTADSSAHTAHTKTTTPIPAQLSDALPSATGEPQHTPDSSHDDAGHVDASSTPKASPTSHEDAPKIGSSNLVINSHTIPLDWISAPDASDLMAVFGSKTLSVGGPDHTIGGSVVSAAPTGLAVVDADPVGSINTEDIVGSASQMASDAGATLQNGRPTDLPTSSDLAMISAGSETSASESSRATPTTKPTSDGSSGAQPSDTTADAIENSGALCLSNYPSTVLLAVVLMLVV